MKLLLLPDFLWFTSLNFFGGKIFLASKFLYQSIIKQSKLQDRNIAHNSTMMSLRSFSRAVPRSFPRVAAQCHSRTLSTISPFRRTSLLQQTCKAMSIPRFAAFSTSQAAREKEGQGMRLPCTIGSLSLTQHSSRPRALSKDRVRARSGKGDARFRKSSFSHHRLP